MRNFQGKIIGILVIVLFSPLCFGFTQELKSIEKDTVPIQELLPDLKAWSLVNEAQNYFSETLYEYINGAAEIYLAYDFKQLIVGEYKKEKSDISVTVEIYDMGNEKNAFGIYSAERFQDNTFISLGTQGYIEDGSLNFLAGKYYVKLLCFECNGKSEEYLKLFGQQICQKFKKKGQWPSLLDVFSKEGVIPNSEKFILKNFLGYRFLHDGYIVSYRLQGHEFDCFLIEGKDSTDAQDMLDKYLQTRKKEDIHQIPLGFVIKDRYYHNIYLAKKGRYLFGVLKIKKGFEELGERYLKFLMDKVFSVAPF